MKLPTFGGLAATSSVLETKNDSNKLIDSVEERKGIDTFLSKTHQIH